MRKNMKVGLVIVFGGVAEVYEHKDVYIRVIDIDNIKAGDPIPVLPKGIGFEELVREAKAEEYVNFAD